MILTSRFTAHALGVALMVADAATAGETRLPAGVSVLEAHGSEIMIEARDARLTEVLEAFGGLVDFEVVFITEPTGTVSIGPTTMPVTDLLHRLLGRSNWVGVHSGQTTGETDPGIVSILVLNDRTIGDVAETPGQTSTPASRGMAADLETKRAAAILRKARGRGDRKALEGALDALARDPSARVRMSAAIALGELRDRRAVPVLAYSLGDEDSSVRIKALEALGRIDDDRATQAILDILLVDPDRFQRIRAAWLLSLKNDDTARRALAMAADEIDPLLGSIAMPDADSFSALTRGERPSGSSRRPVSTR